MRLGSISYSLGGTARGLIGLIDGIVESFCPFFV